MKTLTNFRKRYPYILSLGIIILISGIIVFFLLQVKDEKAKSGLAYQNIVKRILGETVPLLSLEDKKGILNKISKIFKK